MKNILVIYTGGTIGSAYEGNKINIYSTGQASPLIDKFKECSPRSNVSFDTIQPINILSESMDQLHWETILNTIENANISKYDGIIITHGSDTLAYSSAAISFMLCHINIPIILVASNYPLDNIKSNGFSNFSSSVDFILENMIKGTFVIFRDTYGKQVVHLGTRLLSADAYNDDFHCPYNIPFGEMVSGKLIHNPSPLNPSIEDICQSKRQRLPVKFTKDILYIKPYPNIDYSYFMSECKPKAVLHELYHSGTANENGVIEYMNYCNKNGIDFYITPVKRMNNNLYASAKAILDKGAIPIAGMTAECAIVKLMMAYGMYENKQEIMNFLNTTIFFEQYPIDGGI